MMSRAVLVAATVTVFALFAALPAAAAVGRLGNKDSHLFSNDMVLQERAVRVWGDTGSAAPGEVITLQLCNGDAQSTCGMFAAQGQRARRHRRVRGAVACAIHPRSCKTTGWTPS